MVQQQLSVELIDVSKKFGQRQLFSGINASVKSGECLAVTGCNGSGKSTLLKLVAGIGRPTCGLIRTLSHGRQLDAQEQAGMLGMVSPEIIFYHAMTAVENILFLTHARGITCTLAAAQNCCHAVGLQADGDAFVRTFSTGMRQRLKFAVLLAVQPSLWLLDEPSSNLDVEGKKLVGVMIAAALERKVAVMIATNEGWEAQYASHTITLG